ncbi:alpha/beta fold hydrolase [Effusibacillus consociatus]|uniref:Alpha/beta fold hydrolase n=1 Tax=Effusibacillus consociatus TaxID=1117041 RepID=A0ABV9Q5E5_9BACL
MPYCEVDSESIYYERHGSRGAHTLLFVHGAGSTAETWRLCVPDLLQFDCILVDLPGHYRSHGTAREGITEYANFLERFIRRLDPQIHNVSLVGHSMGGAIGLEIACQANTWIQRLIVVTSGSKLKVNENFLSQLSDGKYDLSFVEAGFGSAAAKELIQQVIAHRALVTVESSFRDFMACNQFDRRDDISNIQIPVLLVAGEEDQVTPPFYSVFMHEQIPNSKIEFAKAGHYLPLEQPNLLAAAIHSFLQETELVS